MNLAEFLKYGDKYNSYYLIKENKDGKIEETYWSANGSDDGWIFDELIENWDVISYKAFNNIIYVAIKTTQQSFDAYNHFPDKFKNKLKELIEKETNE